MLKVKTPEEALTIILEMPLSVQPAMEKVPLSQAHGRILFAPLRASEYVPGFDRSSVDGHQIHSDARMPFRRSLPAANISGWAKQLRKHCTRVNAQPFRPEELYRRALTRSS